MKTSISFYLFLRPTQPLICMHHEKVKKKYSEVILFFQNGAIRPSP